MKVLTAKSNAELLGQRSGTAWAGQTSEHKYREYPQKHPTAQRLEQHTFALKQDIPWSSVDAILIVSGIMGGAI